MSLLRWLVGWPWCRHTWSVLHKLPVYEDKPEEPWAWDYHLQCSKCGTVKRKRL